MSVNELELKLFNFGYIATYTSILGERNDLLSVNFHLVFSTEAFILQIS